MKIPFYQIDAFTSSVFKGNPAGVCPLESWLPDEQLQRIAAENNLSETAFLVPTEEFYAIRWFTPELEVDLCGHATLASAYVLFQFLEKERESVTFLSQSGDLIVRKGDGLLEMDFPSRPGEQVETPEPLIKGLRITPRITLKSRDYMAVFDTEEQIRTLDPDMEELKLLSNDGITGIIATAPGEKVDFVSRFFAPGVGVAEDPVTGSSHCTLIPYWAAVLGKSRLYAEQLSKRGGELFCEDMGDKVRIGGDAVVYLEGTIVI